MFLVSCNEVKSAKNEIGVKMIDVLKVPIDSIFEFDMDSILHDASITYSSPENMFSKYELMDLNYDNHNDLIIYRFGCGTGPLTIIDVYYCNPQTGKFVYDNQLSEVTNPSFYLSDSLITGFYIGHGGGNCISIKWNGENWKIYETITIEPSEIENLEWKVTIKNHQIMTTKDTLMELFVVPNTTLLKNKY